MICITELLFQLITNRLSHLPSFITVTMSLIVINTSQFVISSIGMIRALVLVRHLKVKDCSDRRRLLINLQIIFRILVGLELVGAGWDWGWVGLVKFLKNLFNKLMGNINKKKNQGTDCRAIETREKRPPTPRRFTGHKGLTESHLSKRKIKWGIRSQKATKKKRDSICFWRSSSEKKTSTANKQGTQIKQMAGVLHAGFNGKLSFGKESSSAKNENSVWRADTNSTVT